MGNFDSRMDKKGKGRIGSDDQDDQDKLDLAMRIIKQENNNETMCGNRIIIYDGD